MHTFGELFPLHQQIFTKILSLLWRRKINGELAFRDTLLKQNNGEISVLVHRKPTHTDQYLHYSSHHQTSWKESVVSSLFNRAYSIITNKDDLHTKNTRTKQVLKENGYQNHSLPQSQQLTQATDIQGEEIRMSINLH